MSGCATTDTSTRCTNRFWSCCIKIWKIHENELDYWTNVEDPNPEHWWPITKNILDWRKSKGSHSVAN